MCNNTSSAKERDAIAETGCKIEIVQNDENPRPAMGFFSCFLKDQKLMGKVGTGGWLVEKEQTSTAAVCSR